MDNDDFKGAPDLIWYLSKKAVEKGELEEFWKRTNALQPVNLAKLLYSEEIVRRLRSNLKDQTGIYFQMEDVAECLLRIITNAVELTKPKLKVKKKPAVKDTPIIEKIAD
jgi:hypothetical protein